MNNYLTVSAHRLSYRIRNSFLNFKPTATETNWKLFF